jgi:hypothetical protein
VETYRAGEALQGSGDDLFGLGGKNCRKGRQTYLLWAVHSSGSQTFQHPFAVPCRAWMHCHSCCLHLLAHQVLHKLGKFHIVEELLGRDNLLGRLAEADTWYQTLHH